MIILAVAASAHGRDLVSVPEALRLALGERTAVEHLPVTLTEAQLAEARRLAGAAAVPSPAVDRYVGKIDGAVVGTAYVDTTVVRTLPATVLYLVAPAAAGHPAVISRIEILSWGEPADYMPRGGWEKQLEEHPLDDELQLKRALKPMTGATLTSRALTAAARRILALHAVLAGAPAAPSH